MAKSQVISPEGEVVREYDDADLRKDQSAKECAESFALKLTAQRKAEGGEGAFKAVVEGEEDSYADLKLADLLAEAAARKLQVPAKAKKADLVALLEADDAKDPE